MNMGVDGTGGKDLAFAGNHIGAGPITISTPG